MDRATNQLSLFLGLSLDLKSSHDFWKRGKNTYPRISSPLYSVRESSRDLLHSNVGGNSGKSDKRFSRD